MASGSTYGAAAAVAGPSTGELRAKGVTAAPNAVLHPWLQRELTAVLDRLPPSAPVTDAGANQTV